MKVLVTGGTGFLGKAIVRRLVGRGDAVVSLARHATPDLAALGVTQIEGDVADADAVRRAARGVDAVIHTAAKAGVWGSRSAYQRANVVGTANVIAACRELGIGLLVHTSSPSVVFDGSDQEGLDESAPYPRRFLAHYPRTKAEAERLALAANGATLATVALRPHLIWGPGDNHIVPRLIAAMRAGQLRLVDAGRKLVDAVYIDNAADAHLLALDGLAEPATRARVAGKAYFITNHEPWPMARIVGGILRAAGLPERPRAVPAGAAYAAGLVLECVHATLRRGVEPRMTRFMARQFATAHWYDNTAARNDLGYTPSVSMSEGLARLARHLGTPWADHARPATP
jgi:nucleoside-diphosphate-sugar epimerase